MKTLIWLLLVAAALGGGYYLGSDARAPAGAPAETALEHAEKHLDPNYVCPMHPQIVRDQPGSCPICGMDLVVVEPEAESAGAGEILYYRHLHNPEITSDRPMQDEMGMAYVPIYDDGGGGAVKIAPEVVNNLGVRTALVERSRLWRRMDTVGYVDYDESELVHIHLRTDGWIERLFVETLGDRVRKGDPLFELYSPDLVNAQQEYLQALASGNKSLIAASRDRLDALGVSRGQVDALARGGKVQQRVTVYSPHDGIVATLNVREGMYVKLATEVMSLADLATVWVLAELFEQETGWVEPGQPAEVRLSFQPGRTWEGEVDYVYPSLDPKTRTLRARLRFDNPDRALKPNMYADVPIYGGARRGILVIPREALIRTGREQRVILDLGDGRFAPRAVVAGMESGDYVEIQSGLREGERVVTSGQFLIDSEASLKASLKRMQSGAAATQPEAISAQGVLKALMPEQSKLNLQHDPIPAVGWPGMTMDFELAPGVSLEGLAPGDAVEFEMSGRDDGFRILGIRKRSKP
jgi:Cu(I)/Ag(I) efflux system membrane fusion protein